MKSYVVFRAVFFRLHDEQFKIMFEKSEFDSLVGINKKIPSPKNENGISLKHLPVSAYAKLNSNFFNNYLFSSVVTTFRTNCVVLNSCSTI